MFDLKTAKILVMKQVKIKSFSDNTALRYGAAVFLIIAFIFRLTLIYYPFVRFAYLVPPGEDPVNHTKMIEMVLGGSYPATYPWLFHLFIAGIVKIFNLSPIEALKIITPSLVVLPAIGIYFFLSRLYSRTAAFFGSLLALWATNYGLIVFGDGGYPNLIASGFILPIALVYFFKSLMDKGWKNYLLFLLATVLLVMTHHLSTAFFVSVLIFSLASIGLWQFKERLIMGARKIFLIIMLGMVAAIVFLYFCPFANIFSQAIRSFTQTGFFVESVKLKPIEFSSYSWEVGPLTFYGGFFAVLYLAGMLGRNSLEKKQKIIILLILSWFLGFFILSRVEAVSLTVRFARELGMPLLLAMGIALSDMWKQIKSYKAKFIFAVFFLLMVYINLSQINSQLYAKPNYFNSMVWFTEADKEKADYLNTITIGEDTVLSNQFTPYLDLFTETKIIFVYPSNISSEDAFFDFIEKTNARYIVIGEKTKANPRGQDHLFFLPYEKTTELLRGYTDGNDRFEAMRNFSDGSVIYKVAE